MQKYTMIGLGKKETNEVIKHLSEDGRDIYVERDMGIVSCCDDGENIDEEFIEATNNIFDLNIPEDAVLFCEDGDQEFDFYVGFMFEE